MSLSLNSSINDFISPTPYISQTTRNQTYKTLESEGERRGERERERGRERERERERESERERERERE